MGRQPPSTSYRLTHANTCRTVDYHNGRERPNLRFNPSGPHPRMVPYDRMGPSLRPRERNLDNGTPAVCYLGSDMLKPRISLRPLATSPGGSRMPTGQHWPSIPQTRCVELALFPVINPGCLWRVFKIYIADFLGLVFRFPVSNRADLL